MVDINLKINKRFFNEAYLPYKYDTKLGQTRTIVYYGGAGSGKSVWVVQNSILKGLSSRRKFLVMRKVGANLRDSIYQEYKSALEAFGIAHLCKIRDSYLTIELPNGTQFIFRGLEDPERIKSISGISDIILEEATEFTLEDFTQLNLRLRNKKIKNNQIILMYNPTSKSNWVYKMFHDPKTDRPRNCEVVLTTYKHNKFLTDDYIANLDDIKKSNPVYYEIYALGKFASLGKMVYTNWDTGIIAKEKLLKDNYKPHIGMDFGFTTDPTTIIITMVDQVNKIIYIHDEVYQKGMLNSDIYRKLVEKRIDKNKIIADSAEPKSIEELRRNGVHRIKGSRKGKDSIVHGIQFVQGYKIVVHPRCKNTIEELENYGWKPIKGTTEYENKPLDTFNHCMDALRYAMNDLIPKNTFRTISKSAFGL